MIGIENKAIMVLIATRSANIPQNFPALFVQENFLDECLIEISCFPTEETVLSVREDFFSGDGPGPGEEKEDSRLVAADILLDILDDLL